MCCLVTGASGHLGSHLTRLLVERGHSVMALVRPSSDLWRLNDVIDRIRVITSIQELPPSTCKVVFDLAWSGITAATRNLPENIAASACHSLRTFETARAAGCECWIGLGSQAEYGRRDEILNENLLPKPDTAYGEAKLHLGMMLDVLCRQSNIRFVWLRLTAAYGPMDRPDHLIPHVIDTLLSGRAPALRSNGRQQWDYVYVDDAVEAIYAAAQSLEARGALNLAAGHPATVRFIVEQIRDMIEPSLPIVFGEETVDSLRADGARLRKATGWVPRTDINAGLRKTLDWHEGIRLHRPRS